MRKPVPGPLRLPQTVPSKAQQTTQQSSQTLRVATYNIHKGVRGMGPRKRLEIHNLGLEIGRAHV